MPIDMSAAKAPPKKTPRVTSNAPARSTQTTSREEIRNSREEGLSGLAQSAQGLLIGVGLYADAAAVGMHGPRLMSEIARLAETNEIIRKPVDFLIQTGPYAALVQAVIPFAMQIAVNHKLINTTGAFGTEVVPPEVLEAKMKAQMMRMAADAIHQQKEAMREMKEAEAAMAAMMADQTVPDVQTNGHTPI